MIARELVRALEVAVWASAVVLLALFALESSAQTFPTPGPGHAPWVAVLGGGGSYTVYAANATNALFLNSSELGASRHTTTDPDIVLADDFEDQSWYECSCNQRASALAVDNWCGTIFSGSGPTCSEGPNVLNAAINLGAAGSSWAGNTGSMASTSCSSGCQGNMAEHELGPTVQTGYTELWIRWYWKFSDDFNLAGNTKFLSLKTYAPGIPGFDIGAMGTGEGSRKMPICPAYDCQALGFINPQNTGAPSSAFLWPNENGGYIFDAHDGNWTVMEVHIKLETTAGVTQDGIWEYWADDCGPSGLSCPATLTRRAHFTNVRWRAPGNNLPIRVVWFENQRDFSDGGPYNGSNLSTGDHVYLDQVMVKKANGPIGPVVLPN